MTDFKLNPAAPALDEQDRPDQESAVRISLIEVSEYCRSSDLPEILGEVDRELQTVRLGQGRWKEMKLDLMYGDAFCVHPIDYCVEISSEGATFLKENEGIDLNRLLFSAALHRFAKMLNLHGFDLTREFTLEDVLHVLNGFEDRIGFLTRIRDALGRAMAVQYRAAQQAKANEPQTETPPVSPKKPGSRKSAELPEGSQLRGPDRRRSGPQSIGARRCKSQSGTTTQFLVRTQPPVTKFLLTEDRWEFR